jgi:hypothetical protein
VCESQKCKLATKPRGWSAPNRIRALFNLVSLRRRRPPGPILILCFESGCGNARQAVLTRHAAGVTSVGIAQPRCGFLSKAGHRHTSRWRRVALHQRAHSAHSCCPSRVFHRPSEATRQPSKSWTNIRSAALAWSSEPCWLRGGITAPLCLDANRASGWLQEGT